MTSAAALAGGFTVVLAMPNTKPAITDAATLEEDLEFAEIPGKYPFCLPGLLFQRGLLAAKHEQNRDLACAYFLAVRVAARAFLRSFNNIGISDGDTAALPERAAFVLKSLI